LEVADTCNLDVLSGDEVVGARRSEPARQRFGVFHCCSAVA